MTTREDIRGWFEREAGNKGITHMIVVCDTFDYDDYPVYVRRNENIREIESRYDGKNMQKVMEVYSYRHNLEEQLKEDRAFHYD